MNNLPFPWQRWVWAWQDGALRRVLTEDLQRTIAFLLPRKIAYWAFIRVHATCDPHSSFDVVAKHWEAQG